MNERIMAMSKAQNILVIGGGVAGLAASPDWRWRSGCTTGG